jgi:hypothetical protein
LNHLAPNAILHLSIFVHLCETFLGIPPFLSLFRYFFCLKPQPYSDDTHVLSGCGIQFRQGRKNEFFDYDLVDSMRDWRADWFYTANMIYPLAVHSSSSPTVNDRWKKNLLTSDELQVIKPFLERIRTLK